MYPLVRPVRPVLLLPDRHQLLEPIDGVPACLEGLRAMGTAHRHRFCEASLNVFYPPLTGGSRAISAPSRNTTSSPANSLWTARADFPTSPASFGQFSARRRRKSPTVAPGGNSTVRVSVPARSRARANKRT